MGNKKLNYIISKVDDMPVLPDRIKKIIAITEDPDSTIQDLEKEILKDQSLTSKILKLANSAYYGYPRKIDTVSQATILLGFQTIKSMALASTVSKMMSNELKGYALGKNDLWTQSQTCAIISRYIAKEVKFPNPETAYIAGLLRDIGKTILNFYVEKEYHAIINKVESEKIPFLEAEEEILGFNHAQVGEKIAIKWNFPEELVEAIGLHHSPEKATINPILVSIVHIADAITMMMGISIGADGLAYNFSPFALEKLNLTPNDLERLISQSHDLIIDEDSFDL
ncbi:putative nucleotidyltransferase with HDIG domain [Keratinibaculum paraultunense]|uniref:Putative nucleotidyltransferase with HDIG domain n=1 Tax=Keratinibaculum paraultunense TaxID=1278232 RepID=A0A4R3KZ53_9FIRM|nr:HDOD domain-containing protein [Keratinibaculum paraultunense]QQY80076.1 HDOD domain-containing protein [Keratinibaculum paraultunense]TCS91604.1 putative nucleotidyltransferase with HDIG domain [Keratinibaculum paraultunense]